MTDRRSRWNGFRMIDGGDRGHYESWFVRANHPQRPLAFWIRYTVFVPKGESDRSEGELWGIWFDGESRTTLDVHQAFPWQQCRFSDRGLDVRIGSSTLRDGELDGSSTESGRTLQWSLTYGGDQQPLLLLPESMYEASFPKAKALVPLPGARFHGSVTVGSDEHDIDGWIGSQNHNWGTRHTDRYAWGQVAGFDGHDDSFLECATVQLRMGPIWSPRLTMAVLRHDGAEYALNTRWQALRAKGSFDQRRWQFEARSREVSLSGTFESDPDMAAVLSYRNPPGGLKTCVNSKVASCKIRLQPDGEAPIELTARHRAAYEMISDRARP